MPEIFHWPRREVPQHLLQLPQLQRRRITLGVILLLSLRIEPRSL
jgi:hypothetical protein